MTEPVQTNGAPVRVNGFVLTGGTVAERWSEFRQLIEPELAAVRPKPPAPEERGTLLNPQGKGWKPPKVRRYHGKRNGYHWKKKYA